MCLIHTKEHCINSVLGYVVYVRYYNAGLSIEGKSTQLSALMIYLRPIYCVLHVHQIPIPGDVVGTGLCR